MRRLVWFLLKVALLVAAAVWIADRPGEVRLRWLGYEISTEIGLLILAVLLLVAIGAWLYWLWRRALETPKRARRALEASRRRRGYEALTQGLVAIAAGDAADAQKWSKKADQLLQEPPLKLLLAAQTAQLAGDEAAATSQFRAMLERSETKFLGLRGLANQALKSGDEAAALELLREAHRLRPETPWVLETLFDLTERQGRLGEARQLLEESKKLRSLSTSQAARKRAVIAYEEALAAETNGDANQALGLAREALRLSPDFVAALQLAARRLIASGKQREAERLLERGWALTAHPSLGVLYCQAAKAETAAQRLAAIKRLVAGRTNDPEALLLTAEAALEAQELTEAKGLLARAEVSGVSRDQRLLLLQARAAEATHGDSLEAKRLRSQAAQGLAPPQWHCSACQAVSDDWTARCGTCGTFDSLAWRSSGGAAASPLSPTPPAPSAPALAAPESTQAPLVSPEEAARRTP